MEASVTFSIKYVTISFVFLSIKLNLFGTDGIRGEANTGYITPNNVVKLAVSITNYFTNKSDYHSINNKFTVVIGKDTRLSGYMLESALTAGFISAGADIRLLGPIPTPAVAVMTKTLRADLGVVISASHNPYTDNGIKFFNKHGFKLDIDDEIAISNIFNANELALTQSEKIGKALRIDDADGRYIEFVKNSFAKNLNLSGKKIVIDTANGAAYKIARSIFWELGADVRIINDEPNGTNINANCGAIAPQKLCEAVVQNGADIGFAFDGDADRLVVVDENGNIVDGDHTICAIATDWMQLNKIKNKQIVVTNMSNTALDDYCAKLGLSVVRTDVGDKNVLKEMINTKSNIGGEKSGHIIVLDYSTTGDGLISAIQILNYLLRTEEKASCLHNFFTLYPQKCINISEYINKDDKKIKSLLHKLYTEKLAKHVVIRKSGTERVTRIMVESTSQQNLDKSIQLIQNTLY